MSKSTTYLSPMERWVFLETFFEAARGLPPDEAKNLLRDVRAKLYGDTPEQFAQWTRRLKERVAAMDKQIKEGTENG